MDILKELGIILGGTAIGVAALAWLAKSLMTHLLSKDIEQWKAQLDAQNKLEIEKLRADLAKQALEHEVKYRRVDEKVAEHLAGIYQRLFRFYESVSNYVAIIEYSNEPPKDAKLTTVADANGEFWEYFLPNRIYVPPKLYQEIRKVANKLADITKDFSSGLRREEKGIGDLEEDYWGKAFRAVQDEASPLFTTLVHEFQKRLGGV